MLIGSACPSTLSSLGPTAIPQVWISYPTPPAIKTWFVGVGPRVEYCSDGLKDISEKGNLAIRGLLSGPGPRSELKFQGLERPKFICFPGASPKICKEFSELFPKLPRNSDSYSQNFRGISENYSLKTLGEP